jgi:hypothetical protein
VGASLLAKAINQPPQTSVKGARVFLMKNQLAPPPRRRQIELRKLSVSVCDIRLYLSAHNQKIAACGFLLY